VAEYCYFTFKNHISVIFKDICELQVSPDQGDTCAFF